MTVRTELRHTQSVIESQRAMVTANHHLAADAGAAILARGGNAIDAAVATSFAIGVVEPAMSGLGGRGYMVVHFSGHGTNAVIDGHERAPHGASADMFSVVDNAPGDSNEIRALHPRPATENDANNTGPLAVAVPGVVGALAVAHRTYGRLSLAETLEPAIALAEDGFEVTVQLATLLARNRARLAVFPSTAEILMRDGFTLQAGDRLIQKDLAASFRRLAEHGPEDFYRGGIARAIAAELQSRGGVLSETDLSDFQPRVWDRPLVGAYRDYQLLGVPEATGGIALVQIMNLLEGFDLASLDALSPRAIHLVIEAIRIAFSDRLATVDDPDFASVPFAGLASKDFAELRRQLIDPERALVNIEPGDPWAFDDESERLPGYSFAGIGSSDRHTTHFTVVDEDRTIVSMTQSIIGGFGSALVVPGTGILLNNAMSNFNPFPGQVGSIAPWKRATHNGTPTIVLNADGTPRMAIGGAGGTKIITGIVQILVNVLDRGWSLQDAVAAPRIHNEGLDTMIEERVPTTTRAELERMGHRLVVTREAYARPGMSRINGISIEPSEALASGVDVFSDAGASAVE